MYSVPDANTISSYPPALGDVFVAIRQLLTRPTVSCLSSLMRSSGVRSDGGQGPQDCLSCLTLHRPCITGILHAKTKSETQRRTIGWTLDDIAWKGELLAKESEPWYWDTRFNLLHSQPLPLRSLASFKGPDSSKS